MVHIISLESLDYLVSILEKTKGIVEFKAM